MILTTAVGRLTTGYVRWLAALAVAIAACNALTGSAQDLSVGPDAACAPVTASSRCVLAGCACELALCTRAFGGSPMCHAPCSVPGLRCVLQVSAHEDTVTCGDDGLAYGPWLCEGQPAAGTGEPCSVDTECAASLGGPAPGARCVKTSVVDGATLTWRGGYCQSPCRPGKGDAATGLNNTDCPSATAVCAPTSQTTGVCLTACQAVGDCRDQYVCGASWMGAKAPACVPVDASECDPPGDPRPTGRTCATGSCVDLAPDHSFGRCMP